MVRAAATLAFILSISLLSAQSPVAWTFQVEENGEEVNLQAVAAIEDGWYVYSQFLEEGGPVPTTITVSTPGVEPSGEASESGEMLSGYDELFAMNIKKFKHTATFSQPLRAGATAAISGTLEYMACTDRKCLPPETIEINVARR